MNGKWRALFCFVGRLLWVLLQFAAGMLDDAAGLVAQLRIGSKVYNFATQYGAIAAVDGTAGMMQYQGFPSFAEGRSYSRRDALNER
jgi:hypothetical protein